nr:HAD hydrolase-like protein [Nostoc piscinale]
MWSVKADLIHYILMRENLLPETVVMVGDRKHDIIRAKHHHITTIGVTYGYGTEQELQTHGADFIAHSPDEIANFIIYSS